MTRLEAKLNNFILQKTNTSVGLGHAKSLKKPMGTRFRNCKNGNHIHTSNSHVSKILKNNDGTT